MRILITGSSGHLGEALMRTHRLRGDDVIGFDRVPSAWTTHVGDLADRAAVRAAMRGVGAVIHAATLHKPHIATHTKQDFIDANVTGTLNLLESAAAQDVGAFVYTSTTSTFGDALSPPSDAPAAWIDEDVVPVPKNIYGATKLAAEQLCELVHREARLPCIVLRTSRFFPEPDDVEANRAAFDDANLKVVELLYRRCDIEDIVDAHRLAVARAPAIGFGRYIVSATTPFTRDDRPILQRDPARALARRVPGYVAIFAARGWRMPDRIDRVYDNARARRDLGWSPRYDFAHALACVRDGRPWRSALTEAIRIKGYHGDAYADGIYPVAC